MMVFVTHTSGMVYDFWVVTWTGTSISLRFECVAMNGIIINKAAAAKKCRVSRSAIHIPIHIPIHININKYTYIRTYIHSIIYTYIYIYSIHVYMYVYIYIYVYLCVCVRVRIYVYMHICIYAYAHMFKTISIYDPSNTKGFPRVFFLGQAAGPEPQQLQSQQAGVGRSFSSFVEFFELVILL